MLWCDDKSVSDSQKYSKNRQEEEEAVRSSPSPRVGLPVVADRTVSYAERSPMYVCTVVGVHGTQIIDVVRGVLAGKPTQRGEKSCHVVVVAFRVRSCFALLEVLLLGVACVSLLIEYF